MNQRISLCPRSTRTPVSSAGLFCRVVFCDHGLLVDPKALVSNLPLLAVMIGLILVGKFVIWTAVVRPFGYSTWTAILAGVGLTQIGEFSFILVQVARSSGLVGPDVYNATLAASLVTILMNAALVRFVPNWIGKVRLARHAAVHPSFAPQKLERHVVLCGYGRVGSEVGTALDTFRIPYVVIEVDPDIVETLSSRGIFCLFGDGAHERILQEAGVQNASLVVLTLPEGNKNQLVIRGIRRHNPGVPILTRSHSPADQEALLEAGASEIIQPELEASATMIRLSARTACAEEGGRPRTLPFARAFSNPDFTRSAMSALSNWATAAIIGKPVRRSEAYVLRPLHLRRNDKLAINLSL
jgi:CPA2 family monovalent cation:H+ antiporter-2